MPEWPKLKVNDFTSRLKSDENVGRFGKVVGLVLYSVMTNSVEILSTRGSIDVMLWRK